MKIIVERNGAYCATYLDANRDHFAQLVRAHNTKSVREHVTYDLFLVDGDTSLDHVSTDPDCCP